MITTINAKRTTLFTKVDAKDRGTFHSSQNVRYWLVLRALATHRAGEYVSDSKELEAAFQLVVEGVREGRIKLDFAPVSHLQFSIPGSKDPLFLQAMTYWCAILDCSFEIAADAHCEVGNHAPIKNAFAAIVRLKAQQAATRKWQKTIFRETMTPPTVPMPLSA